MNNLLKFVAWTVIAAVGLFLILALLPLVLLFLLIAVFYHLAGGNNFHFVRFRTGRPFPPPPAPDRRPTPDPAADVPASEAVIDVSAVEVTATPERLPESREQSPEK